jgi:hypothetical protein
MMKNKMLLDCYELIFKVYVVKVGFKYTFLNVNNFCNLLFVVLTFVSSMF